MTTRRNFITLLGGAVASARGAGAAASEAAYHRLLGAEHSFGC
ncbi:MAG TPA: hypothetical protein VKG21_06580 [Casimicrobiaceae bacterium]|nr:hypothetical protein [Casimicrobiaceae bacterium]